MFKLITRIMVLIYLYADHVDLQMNCQSLFSCLKVTRVLYLFCETGSLNVIFKVFADIKQAVLFMAFFICSFLAYDCTKNCYIANFRYNCVIFNVAIVFFPM